MLASRLQRLVLLDPFLDESQARDADFGFGHDVRC